MRCVASILLLSALISADEEHDDPNAHFAGEGEWTTRVRVPDRGWTLADKSETEEAGRWILQRVCKNTNFEGKRVISLLELATSKGVSIARATAYVSGIGVGVSALHCAAFNGRADFVESLLAAGADVAGRVATHSNGAALITPLHLIVQEALRIAHAGLGRKPTKVEGLRDSARLLLAQESMVDVDHARRLAEEGWDAFVLRLDDVNDAEPDNDNRHNGTQLGTKEEL